MGFQGVVSLDADEAVQYNPAGLVFTDSIRVSYFRDPFYEPGASNTPLSSFRLGLKFGKYGNAGLEYQNMSSKELSYYDINGKLTTYDPYLKSVAMAYGNKIGGEFSVGAEFRYAWDNDETGNGRNGKLIVSAGMLYQPEKLEKRITLGLSLLNFGNSLETRTITDVYSYPMPASLNLGVNAIPVTNKFYNLDFELSVSKPLIKVDGEGENSAQSSLKSLFNDWDDVLHDLKTSAGLAYLFHPISLGKNTSFIQEMYLGFIGDGSNWKNEGAFTHGLKIGLEMNGILATAGYSGLWYKKNGADILPWENFEFSLSSNLDILNKQQATYEYNVPKKIIIYAGYSLGLVFGRMKEEQLYIGNMKFYNNANWLLGADFYLDENSAVVSSIGYNKLEQRTEWKMLHRDRQQILLGFDFYNEAFSLESGYKYHPLKNFHPLFVQASIGVIRINPDGDSDPKYYYKAYDRISAGCVIPFENEKIIVMPKIALRTIFMESMIEGEDLLGYSQFELGINIGYRF